MEILTLLRANIRRKKGTFISIMLLTAIIVTLITATFSVRDNYDGALDNALEYADCGEINTYIKTEALSDELRQAVENNKLVDRVEYLSSLSTNGAAVGENHEENSYFIMESTEGIKLFNSDADALEESIPELKNGKIYLPLGLKSKLECNVGDTITLELIGDYSPEFKIKGFVQEPTCGALMMGIKYVYVSHGDFQKYYDLCKPLESPKKHIDFTVIRIHQAADSELSPAKFQRQLNMETKIVDNSTFALNSAQTLNYTTLLPDMLLDVVLAFAVLLFVTVLIVMSHSIATEIEIDYTTLGVLKSQGFTKGRIRAVIMLQYLIAEIIGIVFGCLAAIPLERLISGVFESVTAIFPDSGISVVKTLMFTAVIIAVSAILIFLKTRRIAKISPVRAISGGREEIYFSSRLNIPVSKKLLSATLSLRQFTSAKKRYIGAVFITAILTFCMITANLVGNMFSSRNALSMMGYTIADIKVTFGENECDFERVEEIINSHTKIEQKNSTIWRYTSLNGEQLQCVIYQFPEEIN